MKFSNSLISLYTPPVYKHDIIWFGKTLYNPQMSHNFKVEPKIFQINKPNPIRQQHNTTIANKTKKKSNMTC